MITELVIVGSADVRLIVCGPLPGMAKSIVIGVALAVLSAASIASRSDIFPSGPGFATRAFVDEVLPSTVSAAVVTVRVVTGAAEINDTAASAQL